MGINGKTMARSWAAETAIITIVKSFILKFKPLFCSLPFQLARTVCVCLKSGGLGREFEMHPNTPGSILGIKGPMEADKQRRVKKTVNIPQTDP